MPMRSDRWHVRPTPALGEALAKEQRQLGQYFTPAPLVDLVLALCLRSARDRVLDPSCGAGIFLEGAWRWLASHGAPDDAPYPHQVCGFEVSPAWSATASERLARLAQTRRERVCVWPVDFFATRPARRLPGDTRPPGWFDAVVGNPPYVRHERIAADTRARMIAACHDDWPGAAALRSLSTQSDLLAPFFVHAAAFLKPGGRLGFITTNAWLDARYGTWLRRFLLEHFRLLTLVESRRERWFEDAHVNTIIVVLERCSDADIRRQHDARLIQLGLPLVELLRQCGDVDRLARGLLGTGPAPPDDAARIRVIRQIDLVSSRLTPLRSGASRASIFAHRWGSLVRAPDVVFALERRLELFPLESLAQVARGLKTGLNQFFFVDEERRREFGIESRFLRPILRSFRQVPSILVPRTGGLVFVCSLEPHQLEARGFTGALRYIRWGERQRTGGGICWPDVPSLQDGRRCWHALPLAPHHYGRIFWPLAWGARLAHLHAERPLLVDQRLVTLRPRQDVPARRLVMLLNSAIGLLLTELTGRVALGDGALDLPAEDARRTMQLPSPALLDDPASERIFSSLERRPLGTVFAEVAASDRRAFDLSVYRALGLDEDDLAATYEALRLLVQQRIHLR